MPAPQNGAARVQLPAPRASDPGVSSEVPPDVFAAWALAEPDAVLVVRGSDLRVSWVNHAAVTACARDERDLCGRPLAEVLSSPQPPELLSAAELVDDVRAVVREVVVVRPDGVRVPSVLRSQPVGSAWVVRVTALADAARFDDDLRLSRERFLAVTDRAPVGIFFSDVGLRLGYVNDAFAAVFATSPEALLGMRWLDQLSGEEQQALTGAMVEALAGETRELFVRVRRRHGEERTAHVRLMPVRTERRAAGFVGTLEDVTDRLGYEASLEHQAVHDPLTGLVNRRGLLAALNERMSEGGGQRTGDAATLLFLDLDDFKFVNDSLGHEAGDALLAEVGRRLVEAVREGDVVSRFGGDEFALLCPGAPDSAAALDLAGRVMDAVTAPVVVAGVRLDVSGSLGVVVVSQDHREAEDVLRDADAAMYMAKAAGKDCWVLFDDAAREQHRRRHDLVLDLRHALDADQLSVAYQPVVRLGAAVAGAPYAVEALCRWQHPTRGMINPQEFVALAEENGLVGQLSRQVLRAACRQVASWQRAHGALAPSRVCVNVSPLQLRQQGFVEEVARVLRETGLVGSSLCLELTESAVMEDPTLAAASFAALRELGVRVAIDDFGTGYSSLALLRTLPVDLLKIDRSFLAEISEDSAARVVAAVVGLGQALGLEVVAEGVETPAQVIELERLGCGLAQGFLFSRPLTAAQVQARIDDRWPW